MRRALLGSLTTLLAGAAVSFAQAPAPAHGTLPLVPAPVPAGETVTSVLEDENPIAGPILPPPGRFYGSAEYILWFGKPNSPPPLVTAGGLNDVTSAAAIGQNGTTVLFGDQGLDARARSGARVRIGAWLNSEETLGVEAGGFFLEPAGTKFATASDGTTPLGLPFSNADLVFVNPETALLLASPGLASATVNATTRNTVWGSEADARVNLTGGPRYRADLLAGFRYFQFTNDLTLNSASTALDNGFIQFQGAPQPAPATVTTLDHFHTHNDFYGVNLGGTVELRQGPWFADFRGTLALGVVHQVLTIDGSTALVVPDTPTVTVPGGLFAQPTNMGRHSRDEFGIIPEAGVSAGYQIADFVRAYVGYSALYFRNDVLRTGSAIDRSINGTQIPSLSFAPVGTETQPAAVLRNVDFWLQGVHFGVEIDF